MNQMYVTSKTTFIKRLNDYYCSALRGRCTASPVQPVKMYSSALTLLSIFNSA